MVSRNFQLEFKFNSLKTLQSFGLPSLKSKPTQPSEYGMEEGQFGVPDLMKTGLGGAQSCLDTVHPLSQSERNVSHCNVTLF